MSYRVLFSKTARKTYDKLTPKLRNGVDRAIEFLKVNPMHNPNTKALKGEPHSYRYQVGGWRILYEVLEDAREVRIQGYRAKRRRIQTLNPNPVADPARLPVLIYLPKQFLPACNLAGGPTARALMQLSHLQRRHIDGEAVLHIGLSSLS